MINTVLGVDSTSVGSMSPVSRPVWANLKEENEPMIRQKTNYFIRDFTSPESLFSKKNMAVQMKLSSAFQGSSATLPDPFDNVAGSDSDASVHHSLMPVYSTITENGFHAMQSMLTGPGFRGVSGTPYEAPEDSGESHKERRFLQLDCQLDL